MLAWNLWWSVCIRTYHGGILKRKAVHSFVSRSDRLIPARIAAMASLIHALAGNRELVRPYK